MATIHFRMSSLFIINYDVTIIYDDENVVKCDDTKLLGEIKKLLDIFANIVRLICLKNKSDGPR